jgi:hypothetical protein
MKTAVPLLVALVSVAQPVAAGVVTLEEALASTRRNNITWKTLGEALEQADAGRDIGIGLLMPKVQAQGQWLHMGERHVPDLSGLGGDSQQLTDLLGTLTQVVVEEHPDRIGDFAQFLTPADESADAQNPFDDFVPAADTLSATFSLIVPVLNPEGITVLQGAYDRYDAAVQQVGYGREQLLFGVCKAYYGLATLQGMIAAADRSIEAARANHASKKVKADLQAATQLEVKRAELELAQAEARKVDLVAELARSKSTFRYLTGIDGSFEVEAPAWQSNLGKRDLAGWLDLGKRERKDLIAARISVNAAGHDVDGGWTGYLPTLDLIGQAKLDNAEAQRFDDDPFSWNVIATLNLNVFDGGIREANLAMKRSVLRQAELAAEDLARQIVNEVSAAEQSLRDATVARQLAARQLDVARDTLKLTEAGERAGAVTNLEVIDVNTMVFASEASFLAAQLNEAMARLDLLAAAGQPVPFGPADAE